MIYCDTKGVLTDLVQIKRFGEKQRDDNKKFRAWMKRHNFVERRLKIIAQDVEEKIDCTACANCCRVATTQVTERDAENLARFLRVKLSVFLRDYTVETEDEGRILKRDKNGCVFLEGNLCSVYEARPNTCETVSAFGEGERFAAEPHVAYARPCGLLPDCVQHARRMESGNGI